MEVVRCLVGGWGRLGHARGSVNRPLRRTPERKLTEHNRRNREAKISVRLFGVNSYFRTGRRRVESGLARHDSSRRSASNPTTKIGNRAWTLSTTARANADSPRRALFIVEQVELNVAATSTVNQGSPVPRNVAPEELIMPEATWRRLCPFLVGTWSGIKNLSGSGA